MSELDIINAMLSTEGVAAVTSLDARHPSVRKARARLERVNKEVQSEGWWFNKDYNVALTPTATNEIVLPQNTMSADPCDATLAYRKRGSRMYDPHKQTYEIGPDLTDGTLALDITFLLPYSELPQVALDAISANACRRHAMAEDVDPALLRELNADVMRAEVRLKRDHLKRLDVNALNSPQSIRARFYRRGTYGSGTNPSRVGGGNG